MCGQGEAARRALRHGRAMRGGARLLVLSLVAGCAGAVWGLEADAAAPAADDASIASSVENAGSAQDEARLTYGPTGPYDTLWSIARRVKPAGASMAQTMVALVRLNPEAFIDRNLNRIRGGYVLNLPTTAEALATPDGDARRIVSAQDANWEAFQQPAGAGVPDLGEPDPPKVVSRPELAPRAAAAPGAETPRAVTEPAVVERTPGGQELPVAEDRPVAVVDAERQRLAVENTALLAEVDAAPRELEQARARIETLGETVSKQEEQLAALRKQLDQAPSAVPLLDVARSVPMISWLVVGVVILVGVAGVIYQRRRARRLEESTAGYRGQSVIGDPAEAVDEVPAHEEAYEEPDALHESAIPEQFLEEPGTEIPAEVDVAEGYTPNTKLNLAQAYVNMGDEETAREVLEEVLAEGDDAERAAARELLEQLG